MGNHHNGQSQRKLKHRTFHQNATTNDDKYVPFDFNKYDQQQTRRRAATHQVHRNRDNESKGVHFKGVPNKYQKTNNLNGARPKSVKFSSSSSTFSKSKNGISFRKSHNNLPIMHPDEIEAIQKKKKKSNKTKICSKSIIFGG